MAKTRTSGKRVEKVLLSIILLATFWRFFNYSARISFNQDQGRDAIVGLYLLKEKIIMPIGPPSSVGPFDFGPQYYWLITLLSLLSSFTYLGPWIGFTILSVFSVLIFYQFGKKLYGKTFAIIISLITAFSYKEIVDSSELLNPVLISVTTVGVFYVLVKVIKERKLHFSFVLGLLVGLAICFHFQALGLLSLLALSLIFNDFILKKKVVMALEIGLGAVVSFLPLIYLDLLTKNSYLENIFSYFTVGQKKFYFPVRWLTEIKDFWPHFWGNLISGTEWIGYGFGLIFLIALIISFKKKFEFSKTWMIIFLSFVFQLILLRYYHGPRLPVYLIVYQPFLIFFLAWSCWIIFQSKKIAGFLIITFILILSTYSNWNNISNSSNEFPKFKLLEDMLTAKIGEKIDFYQFSNSGNSSMPYFYLLYRDEKTSPNGQKIGICEESRDLKEHPLHCPKENIILTSERISIYDLSKFPDSIEKSGFNQITAKGVYETQFVNFPFLVKKDK